MKAVLLACCENIEPAPLLFKLSESFSPALIRNTEGDNLSESGDTTLLVITNIGADYVELNALPTDLICSTEILWFLMSLEDFNAGGVGYTGDYTTQKKIISFNLPNNRLYLNTVTNLSIGEKVCLYSPFANYKFLPGQTAAGVINSAGAPAWRDKYVQPGPVWYDTVNSRYIMLVNGRSTIANKLQIGWAVSDDLITWTMQNGDAPIILTTDKAFFANNVFATGAPNFIDDDTVAITVCCYDGSNNVRGAIIYFDKDMSGWTLPDTIAFNDIPCYGPSLIYFENKWHLTFLSIIGDISTSKFPHYTSDTIDSGYILEGYVYENEWDGNDSIFCEGYMAGHIMLEEEGELYLIGSGYSRYTMSGNRGNGVHGLFKYDKTGNTWYPHNTFPPEIINPFYFAALGLDYDWASDHCGGCISIFKTDNGKCYYFTAMNNGSDTYQVAALELINRASP